MLYSLSEIPQSEVYQGRMVEHSIACSAGFRRGCPKIRDLSFCQRFLRHLRLLNATSFTPLERFSFSINAGSQ